MTRVASRIQRFTNHPKHQPAHPSQPMVEVYRLLPRLTVSLAGLATMVRAVMTIKTTVVKKPQQQLQDQPNKRIVRGMVMKAETKKVTMAIVMKRAAPTRPPYARLQGQTSKGRARVKPNPRTNRMTNRQHRSIHSKGIPPTLHIYWVRSRPNRMKDPTNWNLLAVMTTNTTIHHWVTEQI